MVGFRLRLNVPLTDLIIEERLQKYGMKLNVALDGKIALQARLCFTSYIFS
jgi:hypothetical protein